MKALSAIIPFLILLLSTTAVVYSPLMTSAIERNTSFPEQTREAFTSIFRDAHLLNHAELSGITLPDGRSMSQDEVSHLKDVVFLWRGLLVAELLLISLAIFLGIRARRKNILETSLRQGALAMLVSIVAAFIIPSSIVTTLFHWAFFPQGNWTFLGDSAILTIFPESFFWAVLLKIAALSLVMIIALLLAADRDGKYTNRKKIYIAVAVFLFLTVFFATDGLNISNQMYARPTEGESKVFGRLAMSAESGILSYGGLLGWCDGLRFWHDEEFNKDSYRKGACVNNDVFVPMEGLNPELLVNYTPRNEEGNTFVPYMSQNGGQGFMFSLLAKFTGVRAFWLLVSALLAASLTLILLWLWSYFGIFVAAMTLMAVCLLKWIAFFGDNLAHLFGIYLAIPIFIGYFLEKDKDKLWLAAFLVFFVKLFMTGAEYIFLAAIIAFVPLAFYAVLRKMRWREIVQKAAAIAAGLALATLVSGALLMGQISMLDPPQNAIEHFVDRSLSRTYYPTASSLNHPFYMNSMNQTTAGLLMSYLRSDTISVFSIYLPSSEIIFMFALFSVVAFILYRKNKDRRLIALMAAVWLSFVAALAWILIAKGHSSFHTYIDPIIWDLPFNILGFALVFATVKALVEYLRERPKVPSEKSP